MSVISSSFTAISRSVAMRSRINSIFRFSVAAW